MILAFEPPDELVEYVFHAAESGCHIVNEHIEQERHEPGRAHVSRVIALHVMSDRKDRRIVQARHIMVHLVRRHVWCDRRPGTDGALQICIMFGEGEPFPGGAHKPIRLGTPMLAWLTNNCHSTFVRALCSPTDSLLADVERADERLAEIYPPGRIVAPATFRSRQRTWKDQ